MKTVLILSQYFFPDLAATGQVLTQLAEDLYKFGLNVKVITGQPNYHGKASEKLPGHGIYNGIEVWRVNYLKFDKRRNLGRILGYISFFLSALLRLFSVRSFDTLLIVSNPPILPLIGYYIKKFRTTKFVYLLHDLYPDVAMKLGVVSNFNLLTKVMIWINQKVFYSADTIVVLGRDVKKLLESKGVSPSKIKVITNWADPNIINTFSGLNLRERLELVNKFVIMYTGNIGLFYDLDAVVLAMERVRDLKDIVMVFVGDGSKKHSLQEIIRRKGLSNIRFISYQPVEHYGDLLRAADVLLVALAKGMEGISVPSKTYGYLAAARPILAVLPAESEIGTLIEDTKCGLRVDPSDINAIEAAIRELYSDGILRDSLAKSAIRVFEEKYQRQKVTKNFLEVI